MSARRTPLPASDELRARLGINLRKHRERLGISQHELAFRAEIHVTAISPLELGQKLPRIDTFIRLAGALAATPNELAAGIAWTPAEQIMAPGGFEVPSDPALSTEISELRETGPHRGRRRSG